MAIRDSVPKITADTKDTEEHPSRRYSGGTGFIRNSITEEVSNPIASAIIR
ncbi:hypothetical protein JNUCC74_07320 [Cerasibacillus sp. JNUCC 74]|uniref:hypothetical protein n=1 Tax=Virgibacillus proomii TaxID=84407 RepID=UPI0015C36D3E|nr:hypothetical protein [Virgibacillus proomii]